MLLPSNNVHLYLYAGAALRSPFGSGALVSSYV